MITPASLCSDVLGGRDKNRRSSYKRILSYTRDDVIVSVLSGFIDLLFRVPIEFDQSPPHFLFSGTRLEGKISKILVTVSIISKSF